MHATPNEDAVKRRQGIYCLPPMTAFDFWRYNLSYQSEWLTWFDLHKSEVSSDL